MLYTHKQRTSFSGVGNIGNNLVRSRLKMTPSEARLYSIEGSKKTGFNIIDILHYTDKL